MDDYPHKYTAKASSLAEGEIKLDSEGLETIPTMPPAQFGGPGTHWSPEALLVASIADCYILTFRAIARASRFEWNSLECSIEGVLDRIDRVTRFTEYHLKVVLRVNAGYNETRARHILENSNTHCLITNSLNGEEYLEYEILVDG